MGDLANQSGGIVMADPPVGGPPAEPPPLPPKTIAELSPVAPSANAAPAVTTAPSVNPFIPQGDVTGPGFQPPKPVAPSPWRRRILMILVFFILITGTVFGLKFILGIFAGNKEVTLTYWGLWENEAIIAGAIADFQAKNPKIKVQYLKQSPRQYRERLTAAINRGEGPDVFRFHNTWLPMIKDDLYPAPETIITAAEFGSSFYPVVVNDLVVDSTIYGLPLMIDGLGLYYNEDLFAAAGVSGPPSSWEELLALVPKIARPDGNGFSTAAIALGTANNVEHFSDILATMMLQNGADLTQPAAREAEEALIFYRKFATVSDPVYTWNQTMDNSIYAFASGRVAMIMAPSWRVFDIKQINPNLRFKIAPIPQLPGSSTTWASYWVEGVSAKSKNKEAAWQFVKFLTSREEAVKLYSETSKTRLFGEPYARLDLADTLKDDPYVGAYLKQAPSAKSFPLASRTADNGLNDKLIKYLEDAVNSLDQGTAPAAALQTAAAGFNQVLSTYGVTASTSR